MDLCVLIHLQFCRKRCQVFVVGNYLLFEFSQLPELGGHVPFFEFHLMKSILLRT